MLPNLIAAGFLLTSFVVNSRAEEIFRPRSMTFENLTLLKETLEASDSSPNRPRRMEFVPDLVTIFGGPSYELGSMDRVRRIAAAGQQILRRSVSWALLLDMAESNPLKTESIAKLMAMSPECRLRLPYQSIQEVLAKLSDPRDRVWALAAGLGDRAPPDHRFPSIKSEERYFSPTLWAADSGAFRGYLIGTQTYERKLEARSHYSMSKLSMLAQAEEARLRNDLESATFYERLALSYDPLIQRDLEWRRTAFREGIPRDLTPGLQATTYGISRLWWNSLTSALESVEQAESCSLNPLILADLFQWQDIGSLMDLVHSHGKEPKDQPAFKRQLKTLILTTSQKLFASGEDHGVRGGFGTQPLLGEFFESDSLPPRLVRSLLELANEAAFEGNSKMTEKSCRDADAIASYFIQIGLVAPTLKEGRKASFIDFETFRNGARATLAAGAAMATSNRKKSRNYTLPTPLSIACSRAFVSLSYLWSGSFDFQEIISAGATHGFGSWSGETVHIKDSQCSDWKFGLQVKDASREEISRPKDRAYNPPKETYDPRLGPPPSVFFTMQDPPPSPCGLEAL